MTTAQIPLPDVKQRLIPDVGTTAWDDLGPRRIRGITLHRMQGTLWGTDQYFRDPASGGRAGLTDFGIDHLTGELLQWNDPTGAAGRVYLRGDPVNGDYVEAGAAGVKAYPVSANRAGWASGPVKAPYGDGAAFVNKYGINAVNRDRVSLEIGGWFSQPGEPASHEDPVSDLCWERIAQFCAHFANAAGIRWDDYPIVPEDGFSFLCWHQEFTIGTGKVCPGKTVMDGTDTLIARTKEVMRLAQTGQGSEGAPPVYAPRHPLPAPTADQTINGHRYLAFPRTLATVRDGVICREYAEPGAAPTQPPLAKGTKVNLAYLCLGGDRQIYAVGTGGSRILLADLMS